MAHTLYPHQAEACKQVMKAMDDGCQSVLVVAPTGSGKSVIGLTAATMALERYAEQSGGILWAALSQELIAQAWATCCHQRVPIPADLLPVTVQGGLWPRATVLVIDEAHHSAASSLLRMRHRVNPSFLIGLTATPDRTDQLGLAYDRIITVGTIQTMIHEDRLAPFTVEEIPSDACQDVTEHFLLHRERLGQTIIFQPHVEAARTVAMTLLHAGVRVAVVTGRHDRSRELAMFESRRIQVLVNVNVLLEGFDSPSIKTVYLRSSTELLMKQMIGRALRYLPGKRAIIIRPITSDYSVDDLTGGL